MFNLLDKQFSKAKLVKVEIQNLFTIFCYDNTMPLPQPEVSINLALFGT